MLPRPHGGRLVNRVIVGRRRERLLDEVKDMPYLVVNEDTAVDLVNIARGVFSPLEGFMVQEDYLSVIHDMRLSNDLPWTIPIVLDVDPDEIAGLQEGDEIVLKNEQDMPLAVLYIEEIYGYDKDEFAEKVFKTRDTKHPGVARVYRMKELLIGGKIELLNEPPNPFARYTLYPAETRVLFREKGWETVVGFQTRNAPHLGHEYLQKTALVFADGIFINPLIGKKKPGDFKDEVILKAYEVLLKHYYPKDVAVLAILRTWMRYAGPREAIFHAIIRKNFGCTHFVVGRDHAGVGNYYGPYEAHEIFKEFPDLGITPLFFREFFYCRKCGGIANEKTCPHGGEDRVRFSGTLIRKLIMEKKKPPEYMMRPEVAEVILKWDKPFVE
ncbi:MAG: sulfate adenylyltransferase [Candidatus Njordarchaeales archaeon]